MDPTRSWGPFHVARFSALLILDPWQTGHSGPPPRSPVFPWLPGRPLPHVLSQLTLEPPGALPAAFSSRYTHTWASLGFKCHPYAKGSLL